MNKFSGVTLLVLMSVIMLTACNTTNTSAVLTREGASGSLNNISLAVFIAQENFHDDIFSAITNRLLNEGATLTVVSYEKGSAVGMENMVVEEVVPLKNVKPEDYNGLVIVGGHGIWQTWDNAELQQLVIKFNESGKLIAAIDSAPGVLAGAGILDQRYATIWEYYSVRLMDFGAYYVNDKKVVVDGNIITAADATALIEFIKTVIAWFDDPAALQYTPAE